MDNGSLKCSLTKQDLVNNGVKIEDFFTNNQTAREFLEKLIHLAEQEVGYKTSGNMMSIQAAVVNEDNIILTFTEHELDGTDIIEKIKNMVNGKIKEKLEESRPDDILMDLKENDDCREKKASKDYRYLVVFEELSDIIRFAKVMIAFDKNENELITNVYKYKNAYYLVVDLNQSDRQYLYSFVSTAMEYSQDMQKNDSFATYLVEHGKHIIGPNAIEELGVLD